MATTAKSPFLQHVTVRLLRVYIFASVGAMNFGYDNNWWSGIINSQSFIDAYGKDNGPGQPRTLPSSWLSVASGTPLAGWIIGCALASLLTSRFGRRKTIMVICVIALVGMVIQCAAHNYWALMVGRIVNALSMGIEANCIPMYMAELAPAAIRGALVNFYQSWLYVGAVIACATVYGSTKNLAGEWVYMTPIVVQLSPPLLLLGAVWFIPESPRWLLQKGRHDEAHKALAYMRHGVSTNEEVAFELGLVERAMLDEAEAHRATGYLDCLRGSNAHRTLVAVGVQCLQQAQGNSFTTTYLVIFLRQIGFGNAQLIATANSCCALGGTVLAFYLSDRIGRRPMLMGGSFFMAALMWIVSGLASWTPGGVQGSSAQGCVAALLIYAAFAAACWGSVMWTVTAEVATSQLRERTISLATICGFIVSLLITYVNPFVQEEPGNLGSRVGMVYASVSILSIFFVYFLVPEMKGRSLEELDEMFHSKVPAWRSRKFVSTGIGAQITNIEGVKVADVYEKTVEKGEAIEEKK
ncbi:General substrate transporter [Niveomyces insectorum RCEF 264]|uniref:General substrate transporter n=1 Tax=Niveomyces insectorum RCEF 264 TaxID=1081102 RepID=A0A167Q890_9HYPO|nr:General substrate transporter [Niveomyces insectorum RCEF 264]